MAATYRVFWSGDDAVVDLYPVIEVCRVTLDPAATPDVAHETELMEALCAGLRATSTFGSYRYERTE